MSLTQRPNWDTDGDPEDRYRVECDFCGSTGPYEGMANLADFAAHRAGYRSFNGGARLDWCGTCEAGQPVYTASVG